MHKLIGYSVFSARDFFENSCYGQVEEEDPSGHADVATCEIPIFPPSLSIFLFYFNLLSNFPAMKN